MKTLNWYEEMGFAITVSDKNGVILYMNKKACDSNEALGGSMVGKNLFDCHPAKSQGRVRELYEKEMTEAYTVEKKGRKKLVYHAPWYENGEFAGIVELSIPLPLEMSHYVRE